MRRLLRPWLLLALGLSANVVWMLAASPHTCTVAWNATTTYVDGTPAPPGVRYRLFFDALHGSPHGEPVVELGTTDGLALTLNRCEAGTYWVTAYARADGSDESAPSVVLVLAKPQ